MSLKEIDFLWCFLLDKIFCECMGEYHSSFKFSKCAAYDLNYKMLADGITYSMERV